MNNFEKIKSMDIDKMAECLVFLIPFKCEPCLYCGSTYCRFVDEINELKQENKQMKSALEEISGLASPHCTQCSKIIKIVNEVLQ